MQSTGAMDVEALYGLSRGRFTAICMSLSCIPNNTDLPYGDETTDVWQHFQKYTQAMNDQRNKHIQLTEANQPINVDTPHQPPHMHIAPTLTHPSHPSHPRHQNYLQRCQYSPFTPHIQSFSHPALNSLGKRLNQTPLLSSFPRTNQNTIIHRMLDGESFGIEQLDTSALDTIVDTHSQINVRLRLDVQKINRIRQNELARIPRRGAYSLNHPIRALFAMLSICESDAYLGYRYSLLKFDLSSISVTASQHSQIPPVLSHRHFTEVLAEQLMMNQLIFPAQKKKLEQAFADRISALSRQRNSLSVSKATYADITRNIAALGGSIISALDDTIITLTLDEDNNNKKNKNKSSKDKDGQSAGGSSRFEHSFRTLRTSAYYVANPPKENERKHNETLRDYDIIGGSGFSSIDMTGPGMGFVSAVHPTGHHKRRKITNRCQRRCAICKKKASYYCVTCSTDDDMNPKFYALCGPRGNQGGQCMIKHMRITRNVRISQLAQHSHHRHHSPHAMSATLMTSPPLNGVSVDFPSLEVDELSM